MIFQNKDAKINYSIQGEGEPLILLHGNQESSEIFKSFLPYLEGYQVILVDSRGHGKSTCDTMTLELMADDLIALIKHLNYVKCHVIGYSDGGNVALLALLKDSSLFDKVVLAGANLNPSGLKPQFLLSFKLQYFLGINKKFNALMINEPQIKFESLDAIYNRILIINGEYDCIKLAHTKLMNDHLKNSSLVILKGINHELFKYEQTYKEIRSFLDEQVDIFN
jgi:hypothetical protein